MRMVLCKGREGRTNEKQKKQSHLFLDKVMKKEEMNVMEC